MKKIHNLLGMYAMYDAMYEMFEGLDMIQSGPLTKVSKPVRGRRVEVRTKPKIGRNELCPCGSGLKYKKCCLLKQK